MRRSAMAYKTLELGESANMLPEAEREIFARIARHRRKERVVLCLALGGIILLGVGAGFLITHYGLRAAGPQARPFSLTIIPTFLGI